MRGFLLALGLLLSPVMLFGAVIWQDTFDYTASQDLAAASTDWSIYNGTTGGVSTEAGSLSYSDPDYGIATAGGKVRLGAGNADYESVNYLVNATEVYWSMLINVTTPKGPNSNSYLAGFRDGTTHIGRIYGDNNGDDTQVRFSIGYNETAANTDFTDWANINTTHLLVGHYQTLGANTQIDLWLNPDLTTPGAAGSTWTETGATATLNKYFLRQGGYWDNGSSNWAADNIVLGTTWADVTGAAVIPEPAALSLMGLAGLLVALYSLNRRS